jgi:hypothetical protein
VTTATPAQARMVYRRMVRCVVRGIARLVRPVIISALEIGVEQELDDGATSRYLKMLDDCCLSLRGKVSNELGRKAP